MSYLKRVTVVKQYLLKRTYFPSSQYISFIMVGSGRSVVIFSKYQNSRPESGWKTMLVERKIKILSADLVCMQNKFGRENKFQIGSSKYNIWQPFCDTFYSCFRCIFFFIFGDKITSYSRKSIIMNICLINACWFNENCFNIGDSIILQ